MKEIVATKKAPEAIGPYSQEVKIGASELLFCSGQIPLDPATGEITGVSIAEQTQQVMENLRAVIEAAEYTNGRCSEDNDLSRCTAKVCTTESIFPTKYR